jgi:hypothetical protein
VGNVAMWRFAPDSNRDDNEENYISKMAYDPRRRNDVGCLWAMISLPVMLLQQLFKWIGKRIKK